MEAELTKNDFVLQKISVMRTLHKFKNKKLT